jgi:hypothetical protein
LPNVLHSRRPLAKACLIKPSHFVEELLKQKQELCDPNLPITKKTELTDLLVRLCETDNFVSSTTKKLLSSGNRDAVYFLL